MASDASYDTVLPPLAGAQKVAALLLVMGKPLASRLLGHFDAAELKVITRAAAELGSVPIDVVENLVEEFAGEFSNGTELLGNADQAEGLLSGVLPPDQVADIMSDVLGNSNRSIWEKIAAIPAPVLTEYLAKQHPQVITLALSKIGARGAASIMEVLPRELRNEVTRRLLSLAPTADAALRVIETRINQDLVLNPPPAAGSGTSRMAEIINKMAPEHGEDVLKALESDRPEDAEALRSKLFSFDDLVTLPQRTRQALFEKVPSEKIVVALSGKDMDFRTNVLSSLAARARRLVENELNSAGDAPPREVAAARRYIADLLLGMAERGEVELRDDEA
jgi:flagellar motor switch protein FliG